jgi:hypothetical protein
VQLAPEKPQQACLAGAVSSKNRPPGAWSKTEMYVLEYRTSAQFYGAAVQSDQVFAHAEMDTRR